MSAKQRTGFLFLLFSISWCSRINLQSSEYLQRGKLPAAQRPNSNCKQVTDLLLNIYKILLWSAEAGCIWSTWIVRMKRSTSEFNFWLACVLLAFQEEGHDRPSAFLSSAQRAAACVFPSPPISHWGCSWISVSAAQKCVNGSDLLDDLSREIMRVQQRCTVKLNKRL